MKLRLETGRIEVEDIATVTTPDGSCLNAVQPPSDWPWRLAATAVNGLRAQRKKLAVAGIKADRTRITFFEPLSGYWVEWS